MEGDWAETLKSRLEELSRGSPLPAEKRVRLLEGERREVAVLFLDMKGYTSLAERMDPEEVQMILQSIHRIFAGEIERHGGWVEKIIGDGLMAVFGAKEAHEDDCTRAIRAGLGILKSLDRINDVLRDRDISVDIRIGISAGLVATGRRYGDMIVTGDTVNTASRLEESAPVRGILVSKEVRERAGDEFIYEPLGTISIKGRRGAVEAHLVKGVNPQKPERWERCPVLGRSKLVGREREIELLNLSYSKLRRRGEKRPLAVGIKASMGLGKSRLIHDFLKSLMEDENRRTEVLQGYTLSYINNPYWIFLTLLRRYLGIGEEDEENGREKLEGGIERLARCISDPVVSRKLLSSLPILGYLLEIRYPDPRLKNPDPRELRTEVKLSLKHFLGAMAEETFAKYGNPLVVHLEDLHWMSAESGEALEYILEGLRASPPSLFLLSYRPDYQIPEGIARSGRFKEIELGPLDDRSVLEIVRSMLGDIKLPPAVIHDILEKSMGNPFFVEELVHSLVESGAVCRDGEVWKVVREVDELSIPGTVSGVILSRIDLLGRRARELLQRASVVGMEFSQRVIELIGEKMGEDPRDVERQLQILCEANLITRVEGEAEPTFAFRHSLIREVIYSTILNYNKRILHELTAEALEEIHAGHLDKYLTVLAYHYSQTDSVEKAIDYAEMSGDRAKGVYANERAIEYYTQALEIAVSTGMVTPQRARIHGKRSEIWNLLGERDRQEADIEEMLRLSEEIGDEALASDALNLLGELYIWIDKYSEAEDVARRALSIKRELGDRLGEARSLEIIGEAYSHWGNDSRALRNFKRALKIYSGAGERRGEAINLNKIGGAYRRLGNFDLALKSFKRSLKIHREIGDRWGEEWTRTTMGLVYLLLGDYTHALESWERSLEIFREVGDRNGEGRTLNRLGIAYLRLGAYDRAMENLRLSLKIHRDTKNKRREAEYLSITGEIHLNMGNIPRAIRRFDRSLKVAREIEDKHGEELNLLFLGIAHILGGHYERALEFLRESHRVGREAGECAYLVENLSFMGLAHWGLGDFEGARRYSERAIRSLSAGRKSTLPEQELYFNHYKILSSTEETKEDALEFLRRAHDLVLDLASKIADAELRRSFLENVRVNREIISAIRARAPLSQSR
ncbi:MAG: ATP-binding protein [bacterium]